MKSVSTAVLSLVAMSGIAMAQESIVVSVYGGVTGKVLESCVFSPFSKETGIKVLPEPGASLVTFNKLVQQRDKPAIDVAWMDGGISELAEAAGVVDTIDRKAVPNLSNLVEAGIYKNDKGEVFAVSGGMNALGIVYNTEQVKTPPTSWSDLWDPQYENVVTMPSPNNAMGTPLIEAFAETFGKDKDDTAAAFKKLKELKPAMFYDASGAADNAFQSREVDIGAHYHYTASTMADQGMPTAYVAPKEGAIAGDIRAHIVKNSAKRDMAVKFIDFLTRPEPLNCIGENLFFAPPLKNPTLSEKARKRMPWGENGSIADLKMVNWKAINAKRAAMTDQWNREIATKK